MWSRKFSECIKCHRSDRPHMAKGLCSYCYSMAYQTKPEHMDRVKQQKHDYYMRQGGPAFSKETREERWFDGQRDAVLQRDGFKCHRCGCFDPKSLVVHHRDGNGRGSPSPNNSLENLITACHACHASHHSTNTGWSRNYPCCQSCGTTERKHNAKGLCWKCYLEQHPST
jgi:hypothetical protein